MRGAAVGAKARQPTGLLFLHDIKFHKRRSSCEQRRLPQSEIATSHFVLMPIHPQEFQLRG